MIVKRLFVLLLLPCLLLLTSCSKATANISISRARISFPTLVVADAGRFNGGTGGSSILQGIDTLDEAEAALEASLDAAGFTIAERVTHADQSIAYLLLQNETEHPICIRFEEDSDGIMVHLRRAELPVNGAETYPFPLHLVSDPEVLFTLYPGSRDASHPDYMKFTLAPVEAADIDGSTVSLQTQEDFLSAFLAYYLTYTDLTAAQEQSQLTLRNGNTEFTLRFGSYGAEPTVFVRLLRDR